MAGRQEGRYAGEGCVLDWTGRGLFDWRGCMLDMTWEGVCLFDVGGGGCVLFCQRRLVEF